MHAVPISILGQYFAASKGVKDAQAEDFNPFAACLYQQDARELISPAAAATFLELSAAQLVPAWAIAQLNIKQLRAAK